MVEIMFELLRIADKTDKYNYFHYFSDSCYLATSLEEFYKFFENNNNKTYITYFLENKILFKKNSFTLYKALYKGSQWMSLHYSITHKLLDNLYLFNKYKEALMDGTIKLNGGAPDEFIFTQIILNDICKGNPQKYDIINNNLRFTRWKDCESVYCPNYLEQNNVSEEEIKSIKKNNYLVIRKIDYKNFNAIDLINRLKGE